jgi:hypothetical protein
MLGGFWYDRTLSLSLAYNHALRTYDLTDLQPPGPTTEDVFIYKYNTDINTYKPIYKKHSSSLASAYRELFYQYSPDRPFVPNLVPSSESTRLAIKPYALIGSNYGYGATMSPYPEPAPIYTPGEGYAPLSDGEQFALSQQVRLVLYGTEVPNTLNVVGVFKGRSEQFSS